MLLLCVVFPYSKVETAAIETELLRDYRFGQQQLIEIWGHACAIAITKVCTPYPPILSPRITFFGTIHPFIHPSIPHSPDSDAVPPNSISKPCNVLIAGDVQ